MPTRALDSIIQPVQRLAEATPFALIVAPVVGVVTAIWGEAYAIALLLLVLAQGWDWLLGGQVAARRDHYLKLLGVTSPFARERKGGFSFSRARHGLQGKVNLLVAVSLFAAIEAWGMAALGNPVVRGIDAALPLDLETGGRNAVLGTIVLVAAALQELRSAERNRRLLGGQALPIFSAAIEGLDRAASKLVPHPEGWRADLADVQTVEEWYREELRRGRGRRESDHDGDTTTTST